MMDDFMKQCGVQVHIVKAFTDSRIATIGNPAGVVLLNEMPQPDMMASIAIKAQQPITAFVVPKKDKIGEFLIRYYDLGGRECHICGHATVAATRCLCEQFPSLRQIELSFELNEKLFGGIKKELKTRALGDSIDIELFPSILEPVEDPEFIAMISRILGISSAEIVSAAFSRNVRDYVLALASPDALLNMKPDFSAMKEMAEGGKFPHEGMMVSSKAQAGSCFDLFVRVFLPITGVNEDIACGSGNCSIVPFWYELGLNIDTKTYRAAFPYPDAGGNGVYGGVQFVVYEPENEKIIIKSQATISGCTVIEDILPDEGEKFGRHGTGCDLATRELL